MNQGARIKSLRKERGLTQAELAELSGLSIRTIQRMENNEVNPSTFSLKMLSKALEIDLKALNSQKKNSFHLNLSKSLMNIINPILGNFTIRKVFVSSIMLIIVFSLYLWLPTKSVTDYSPNDHQYSVATINCGDESVCDIEVTKKEKDGKILWQHTFGGSSYDRAGEVISTKDGGCLVVGSTSSFGKGNYDALLLKINVDGELIWQETYGGFFNDYGKKISRLSDSNGYSIEGTHQACDTPNVSNECIDFFWKFEIDESGKLKG
ncbi:Predicted transcriptional regulators [Aquiflexum balticum DSM 16537]|uniref:Predicted transcriptional regulators n=1 Tax=Aquiflexum balticum DSM 16537 TaxID=758820 RepID=A0A1W2GZ00_9BACT|nr:helix-turn-helix domain-containing protein [Aquiflexum balticum]SMD41568.1 Predicted transcriptional regulators [Aquiflexum balticum DSM 16537]